MIIVKLAGGIGNQLFQYAAAKSMAKRFNQSLYIDIEHYKKYNDRKFKLKELYNIEEEVIEQTMKPLTFKICSNRYVNYIIRKCKLNIRLKNNYICQYSFDIDNRLLLDKGYKNYYIDGFWQNEEYFKSEEDYIRNIFKLKKEAFKNEINHVLEDIEKSDSVSVHIRRGDYMSPKNMEIYGLCSLEYYENAIKYISNKVKNPKFYFFSDDINWVKENINIDYDSVFIDGNYEDYEELYMMSKCSHNIIANSSFSWWGAWLNDNEKKIIIAPKKWTNKLNTSEQILPKEWVKI